MTNEQGISQQLKAIEWGYAEDRSPPITTQEISDGFRKAMNKWLRSEKPGTVLELKLKDINPLFKKCHR